ncbi:MAG TPA: hypothetical protein VJH92_06130 [Candidatus Nanoarchaeia archaeon]|nr:hypothetical protein [Candidatus Nanoarchaeia archaeon]
MKKAYSLLIVGLMVLFMVQAVSAVTSNTLIAGKIYNADYSSTIAGANVTVNCDGNVQSVASLSDGAYSVTYDGSLCFDGSSLTVSATKDSLYGSNTGIIHNEVMEGWDLAIVNVPLVPEFGIVIGILTMLGAVGVFFMIRRN